MWKLTCSPGPSPPALPTRNPQGRLSTSSVLPARGVKDQERYLCWKPVQGKERDSPPKEPQRPGCVVTTPHQLTARGTVREDTDTFADVRSALDPRWVSRCQSEWEPVQAQKDRVWCSVRHGKGWVLQSHMQFLLGENGKKKKKKELGFEE